MKFCYCDETGTGEEPFAVIVGVLVDAKRMHLTKRDWKELLLVLSRAIDKNIQELHTSNFYSGSGIWKGIDGPKRAEVITLFLKWFSERKHHLVFSAIDKEKFNELKDKGRVFDEVDTVWRAMGFHMALSVQKNYQKEPNNKGNTIFIMDEKVTEEARFQKLILTPPEWSDTYYDRSKKQEQLNQIIDSPYFADSKNVALIQTADFIVYFMRRYIEIKTGKVPAKYTTEEEKLDEWFSLIKSRFIPMSAMYPKTKRCDTANLFWDLAPECIRNA